jgi:hypothetical protein
MRPLSLFAYCIIWLAASTAEARPSGILIDDSATLPHDAALAMRWQQPTPRGPNGTRMTGVLSLRVKLNVGPWLRHSGKIYLVLPAQQPGGVTATWTTQGRLLPGQVLSGGRTLVYAGPITAPFLEDTVLLTLVVDGRRLQQLTYHLDFHFEMDED